MMARAPRRPYLDRLAVLRCRLTYAQQRIRELEALLASNGIGIPEAVTQVPPPRHSCVSAPPS